MSNTKTQKVKQAIPYDYPFSVQTLLDGTGRETGYSSIRNDLTGEYFRPHTGRYKVVPFADLIDEAKKGIEELGYEDVMESRIVTTHGGARLSAEFTLPTIKKSLAKVGDPVACKVRVESSYDLTIRNKSTSGLVVLRCTNGMTGFEKGASFNQKHSQLVDLSLLKKSLENSIDCFNQTVDIYSQMAGITISDDQALYLLTNLVKTVYFSRRQARDIYNIWKDGRQDGTRHTVDNKGKNTLYGIADAITYKTSNLMPHKPELADKMNEYVLGRLRVAAVSSAKLGALIAKPKKTILDAKEKNAAVIDV